MKLARIHRTETVFLANRTECGSARSHNVSSPSATPCFHEKFFRMPAFGQYGRMDPDGAAAKHLSAPSASASASTSRASVTRASFLFCRNYFPGRAFCLISAHRCFLFVGTTVLSSFYEKGSFPASLTKLFNSWRKYDRSESTEASVKEHGNALCPRFLLPFQVARNTSCILVRDHVETTYRTSTIGLLI